MRRPALVCSALLCPALPRSCCAALNAALCMCMCLAAASLGLGLGLGLGFQSFCRSSTPARASLSLSLSLSPSCLVGSRKSTLGFSTNRYTDPDADADADADADREQSKANTTTPDRKRKRKRKRRLKFRKEPRSPDFPTVMCAVRCPVCLSPLSFIVPAPAPIPIESQSRLLCAGTSACGGSSSGCNDEPSDGGPGGAH